MTQREAIESRTIESERWKQKKKQKGGGGEAFRRQKGGKSERNGRWRERETEALPMAFQRNKVTLCVRTSSEEVSW